MNSDWYHIDKVDEIYSPGLIIFRELVDHNLQEMIRIAGGANRLRPHCKTHKTREITLLQRNAGITRQKCATIAEAEMMGELGVTDVLLAYPMVGPNQSRFQKLRDTFPNTRFSCLVDSPEWVLNLPNPTHADRREKPVNVFLDLDPGMHRTGIEPGQEALQLCELIQSTEGINLAGLHWYDGQHRHPDFFERKRAVLHGWERLTGFRDQLLMNGITIQTIVAGGTGSFPILAEVDEPGLELSPGTTTYYDALMAKQYPELDFRPALAILTRVISNNRAGFLTLDLGHKACAADQPAGKRVAFPAVPDAAEIQHSEEHLVIKTSLSEQFELGDYLIAIPYHACPTSAVFDRAKIIANGQPVEEWTIAARQRVLSI